MKTSSFIADSTADALAQVREQLGPEAVVLKMWHLPAAGLSKMWRKRRVGVLAGVVEGAATEQDLRVCLLEKISELNRQLPPLSEQDRGAIESLIRERTRAGAGHGVPALAGGVLPLEGGSVPSKFEGETASGRLKPGLHAPSPSTWKTHATQSQTHLLIGPPGVGKTTCLSKWLAQSVLLGGRTAQIWRLDGRTANTAESLSVYAEILGVPVARSWCTEPDTAPPDINFIDLPGIDCFEPEALDELRQRIAEFGSPCVHLVLNAAYELPLLLQQAERFSALPVADVIFTHLDEQRDLGKLQRFASATGFPIAFLSAGQNVPGTFREASADLLSGSTFPENIVGGSPNSAFSGKASAETGTVL